MTSSLRLEPHRCLRLRKIASSLGSVIGPLAGLALLSLASPNTAAQTAAASAPAAPAPSLFDKFSNDARNPVKWMSWGADMRVRNEYMDNIITLNDKADLHEQDVIRYRGRVWASFFPFEGLSLNTRLSAEPRQFFKGGFPSTYRGQTGMEWRYGIFDVLNVKYTNAFNLPLSITAGRQDVSFGDFWNWWLVADGTPADGSWAFFLDGIRLTYDIADVQTKVDVMYIYQNARPDAWIPTLGRSSDMYLTEQTEQGVILYGSNKSIKNTQVDGYFIYKRDDQELVIGDNADIYTLGSRITGTPWTHWQYSLEGAYQFGEKQDPTLKAAPAPNTWRDLSAYGANARLTYMFKDSLNNQASLYYEILSGDDPNTEDDEMFDILWGRWPRFSEGYIYSYINENGGKVAQINNIQRVGFGWSLNPMKQMTLSAIYNAWFAPEDVATRARIPNLFSGDGSFRGHYLQTILKHQFNKHVSAHLWGEFIWSGDYYATQPFMDFIRAEVLMTF